MAIKYGKEFIKPDGRKLASGGPRDLQRRQKQVAREQTELIDFLRSEIRDLNERLAIKTVGTGEYTGEQVDNEIRKAVADAVKEVKVSTEEELTELRAAAEKKLNGVETKYSALEQEVINVENQRVSLANELLEVKSGGDPDELYKSRKRGEELQIELGKLTKERTKLNEDIMSLVSEKDGLNILHNKDMKKFQAEIEFLIKEKTDLTNKQNKEISKFQLELEKKKGEIKVLKAKTKQTGADEEITSLLKEQTKQIEALTEALANAEHQLEIETNRPKMKTAFIDPLEKDAGSDLKSHIEIKDEASSGEKGKIDDKVARLRSLMGKLPKANG